MTNDHRPRQTVRTMGGWSALAVLLVVIAAVLYFTLIRKDPAVELKPASRTAQAMYDGTHIDTATTNRR